MLSHVLRDTVHIFKEAHMAKLIHLIMTDRLDLQLLLNILQIDSRKLQSQPDRNPGS